MTSRQYAQWSSGLLRMNVRVFYPIQKF